MPTTTSQAPIQDIPRETPPGSSTFLEHLGELRRRLGICLAALVVAIGVTATQVHGVIDWLRRPADGLLNRFAFFSPTEPLMAYMKVACLGGVLLAMPLILWQFWGFVRTGLTRRERSYGLAFVWWGTLLFAGGLAFAYYLLLPVSLRFLLGIGQGAFEPVISIETYLSFVTTILFWCGLVFELPIVLVLLVNVGIVTPEWLRQQRPYAILVLVILAAIITPTTDAVNLLLMTVPLLVLYELSIWLTRWVMRRTTQDR